MGGVWRQQSRRRRRPGRLGWSRSAPGAGVQAADGAARRSPSFPYRRPVARLPPQPADRGGAARALGARSVPANSPAARAGFGTKHQGTMVYKTLFALCIFTAGILGRQSGGGLARRLALGAGAEPGRPGNKSPRAGGRSGASLQRFAELRAHLDLQRCAFLEILGRAGPRG